MYKNVKTIGNNTEKLLCQYLRSFGYWAHLMADKIGGQPVDIVAISKDKHILIDSKHCSKDYFYFGCIQPNQRDTFKYASFLGIEKLGFSLYYADCFYWLPFEKVEEIEKEGKAGIKIEELEKLEEVL